MFKSVDEKLHDLGFIKAEENYYGAVYKRYSEEFKYTQRIDILHKASGKHLIQSYQQGVNSDGFNNTVGLTYEETKLVMKKYRQLFKKYKWN